MSMTTRLAAEAAEKQEEAAAMARLSHAEIEWDSLRAQGGLWIDEAADRLWAPVRSHRPTPASSWAFTLDLDGGLVWLKPVEGPRWSERVAAIEADRARREQEAQAQLERARASAQHEVPLSFLAGLPLPTLAEAARTIEAVGGSVTVEDERLVIRTPTLRYEDQARVRAAAKVLAAAERFVVQHGSGELPDVQVSASGWPIEDEAHG